MILVSICPTIIICCIHVQISKMSPDINENGEVITFWNLLHSEFQGDIIVTIFTMRVNVDLSKAILSPLLAAIRTWTSFWLRDWKSKFWHIFEEIYQKKLISHLVILHSWTLFLVTFADAKVIKHVEPDIKLRERDDDQHLKCFPWQALGITWFTPTMLLIVIITPVNLDQLLEEHDSPRAVAFRIERRRPGGETHHVGDNHQYCKNRTKKLHDDW